MKNFIKSLFISAFPVYALVIFTKTLLTNSFSLHNIGVLVSSIAVVLFFSMLFIKPVARTTKTLTFYSALISIGFVLNLLDFNRDSLLIPLSIALGWLAYLTWYSTFNSRDMSVLDFGKKLPEFSLENTENEMVNSNSFTGDFKIFIFYRGNWCPLCMAQIKEVVREYKELEKRKVDMLLISSQPHKFTKSLAKKHQVPFHFLRDIDNRVAKQLKIIHENGLPAGFQVLGYESDVVLPTVIITDKNDKIIFADLTDNYRVRPEPATFLRIIDNYKG
ncbi:peroxiredoxin family protein [uncultured Tenacibaculum sp.]|uniref:peroxiredoxin family protein n=1 Tax=uncultured Tenacibaculum sp. TaxID=174713 RepID=UPI00261FD613|nr:peroxiredoxin family protein [uncultured Tenacibaculum sp.]